MIKAAFVALALMLPFTVPVRAQGTAPMQLYEQKVKAGLVYNFLKYTSWPEGAFPDNDIKVCLYGGDALDGYLYPLDGRTAQQYRIIVKNVQTMQAAANCHTVFIHRDEAYALPELLPYLHNHKVLTISDIGGFAKQGGIVELSKQPDKRIHLFVNKKAVDAAGLNLSDRVMKLAQIVD